MTALLPYLPAAFAILAAVPLWIASAPDGRLAADLADTRARRAALEAGR